MATQQVIIAGRLFFLRDDPTLSVYKYPVAVAVLTGHNVVVVTLLEGADDLAAG